MNKKIWKYAAPWVTFSIVIVLWYVIIDVNNLRSVILPPPHRVLVRWVTGLPEFVSAAVFTYTNEALPAFLLASSGILLAILAIVFKRLRGGIAIISMISSSVPIVVLAPLFYLWLGIGNEPKVILGALFGFFPIFLTSYTGLINFPKELMESVRSVGASRLQEIWFVQLPMALPSVFNALQIGAVSSLVGVVVAEFFSSPSGSLGYLIYVKNAQMDRVTVFAAAATLLVLAGVNLLAISLLERILLPRHV